MAKTEVGSLDNCNNASGSMPLVNSVFDETVKASKPAVSSNRTMIVFDKTDSTSNSVANSEAFSKAKTLVVTTENKAGNMPKMNSVSQETIQAVSRPILKSAVNSRMSKVFHKTKADRNLASKLILEIKNFKNDGRVSALKRIQASNTEAKGKTISVDTQLASNDEAINAQLALNGEAIMDA